MTRLRPGNWIHNLEHGYVVLLYKGEPGRGHARRAASGS